MRKLIPLILLASILLVYAIPATAGTFWNDGDMRLKRTTSSAKCPPGTGWIRLTVGEASAVEGVQPYHIKSVDGKPVEMTAGEKAAVDLVRTRSQARGRLQAAVLDLLASQEVKARLSAAGKSETLIDARIATLDAAISTALSNHP